jgi:hypothetical protein
VARANTVKDAAWNSPIEAAIRHGQIRCQPTVLVHARFVDQQDVNHTGPGQPQWLISIFQDQMDGCSFGLGWGAGEYDDTSNRAPSFDGIYLNRSLGVCPSDLGVNRIITAQGR